VAARGVSAGLPGGEGAPRPTDPEFEQPARRHVRRARPRQRHFRACGRSHAIDDLGIDSLAFLDIAFAVDKAFGIKLPLERWTQEVNEGKVPAEEYFVLKNLCARIDGLVAEKAAKV
jgi:hypothetical protein